MRVAIVGAGLGGLTLALALARQGVASVVLERSAVLGEVGAGVQLSPNAVKCLYWLGLEAEVREISSAPAAVEIRDHRSQERLLTTLLGETAERRWGAPYLQIHRADLHRVLLQAVERAGGAAVRLGVEAASVDDQGVTAVSGDRYGGDLIVGCDGLRSAVRRLAIGDGPARYTGAVAWRATAPFDDLPAEVSLTTTTVWTGSNRHFLHYPVRAGRLLNIVAVTDGQGWRGESWSEPGDRSMLVDAFSRWPDEVTGVIGASNAWMRWGLYDRAPLARWTKGRVTLLGDAAHPMSPYLAQGAGMAIEDAVVLARALQADTNIESALARYGLARRARTAKAQAWSRRNARLFHLPSLAARGAFAVAHGFDRTRGRDSAARLDWLYGYDATAARI